MSNHVTSYEDPQHGFPDQAPSLLPLSYAYATPSAVFPSWWRGRSGGYDVETGEDCEMARGERVCRRGKSPPSFKTSESCTGHSFVARHLFLRWGSFDCVTLLRVLSLFFVFLS